MTDRAAAILALGAALDDADRWVRGLEAKTIAQIVRRYEDLLQRIVRDAIRTGDAVDMRRAHKALLKDLAPQAYEEGMREGGISQPDTEDQAAMDEASSDWVAAQSDFVNAFAKDAAAAKKASETSDGVLGRIDQWVSSLRNFGEAGKLYALGNIPLTFDGDDGEESCDDCQNYKGQRHRRNWWADRGLLERNGNVNYICGRWDACQHSFRDDGGKVIVS